MMKKLIFLIAAVLTCVSLRAQSSIEVTISNIRENKGSLIVGLFNNSETFLEKAVQSKIVKVDKNSVTILFDNLSPGQYAVSVIHDENDNGELDKNFMGIPKEGFVFGNNAMGTFGPPSFEKASVTLDGKKVKQDLELKYM